MNQEKECQINLKLHHIPPWNAIDMTREPPTHKINKEFKEKYLSSCFDETYDLTQSEIKDWWELRQELYYLYDPEIENNVKRLTGLWYLLTDTECPSIKNPKWTEFGFQQQDPTTDFRGGGLQSLDDIVNFVTEHKEYVLKEMCNPKNDFYFAASSINITFFLKKYFHLQEKLDRRDKNEIADRVGLKNFCRLLNKEENLWSKLHKLVFMDLFQTWIKLRVEKPGTTIMDYGIAIESAKRKVKAVFSQRIYVNYEELKSAYKEQKS